MGITAPIGNPFVSGNQPSGFPGPMPFFPSNVMMGQPSQDLFARNSNNSLTAPNNAQGVGGTLPLSSSNFISTNRAQQQPTVVLPSSYQAGPVPYARSFPISSTLPPIPEIPAPPLTAPWLYNGGGNRYIPVGGNAFQNNYYNNGVGGGAPTGGGQGQGQGQAMAPEPQPMPQMPPQMPQQQQQPQQPAEKPAANPLGQNEQNNTQKTTTLTDEFVRSLNARLNNPNEMVRADAAMDFYKVLEVDPNISTDPIYKPYIDAFIIKILSDPSPLVRHSMLLAGQMRLIKDPSPEVRNLLQNLSNGEALFNIEGDVAKGVLGVLDKPIPQPQPIQQQTTQTQNTQVPGFPQPPEQQQPGGISNFNHQLQGIPFNPPNMSPPQGQSPTLMGPNNGPAGQQLNIESMMPTNLLAPNAAAIPVAGQGGKLNVYQ